MSQTVVVSPTTRHEGHAKLVLEVDDNGIVTQGNYLSTTPVRGFEKFITGKAMEFAPIASSRFCGICPITHASASTDAIDRALGITPPKDGVVLKHLCNMGNKLHSHPLHNLLLLPDFFKADPNGQLAATVRIQKLRKVGQAIVDITGGEAIHAPNIRIGGMKTNISEAAKRKILEMLKEYEPIMKEQNEAMLNAFKNSDVPKTLGVHNNELMATDLHYGNADLFEQEYFYRFTEITPRSWYPKAEVGEEACGTAPLIGGKAVEGGPKARMTRFAGFGAKDCFGFDPKGAMAINIARQMEIPLTLAKARELATQLDTTKPTMNKPPEAGGDGERLGVGPQEAPRGVNVHCAKVKDGKITYYNCLVATTWNILTVGKACEGQHYKWAEYVVRAYDPCVSCSTHMIVVDEEGKLVAEGNI